MPISAWGTTYHFTCRSRRSEATVRMTTSGYIAMRWYQHRTHGGNLATSDR